MKRPIIPLPRRATPFSEKFGRGVEHFGSKEKREPPQKSYLPHIIIGMACAFLLCIFVILLGKLPKVREVRAEGGRYYSAEVMLHYANVKTGDELWGFDSYAVEAQMKTYLPLLKSARVHKHLNGDITVSGTEYESLYYTCHNRNYYVFTTDTREVLCALPTDSEPRRVGAIYIGLPESARVRVGDPITFIHLPYAPETPAETSRVDFEPETQAPEVENAYVDTFIKTLMDSPLAPSVTGMELSDRYDLWLVLDGSVKVSVGGMSELEEKLLMAHRAIEERKASGVDSGDMPLSVDVSNPARIVLRASPNIQLPPWAT